MQLSELRGKSQRADDAFRWLAVAAAASVLLVLALVASTMTERAIPVLSKMGLAFFTSSSWSEAATHYGALSFIYGTLYTAVLALLVAVPVSLGVALFITQVAPRWLKKPMIYLIDLCAVVPSGTWSPL